MDAARQLVDVSWFYWVRDDVACGELAREVEEVLPLAECRAAQEEITDWPEYQPSPLRNLGKLGGDLGLEGVFWQDESRRFGLKSFKGLGGAYAVLRCAAEFLAEKTGKPAPSRREMETGRYAELLSSYTVATATDGNHGRAVAWGAKKLGCRAVIYIHQFVSENRKQAMEELGATVIRCEGNYDDSVRRAGEDAHKHGWQVISDTSYEGYEAVPKLVMCGYTLMVEEALQTMDRPPTHVFVQGGVGALAAAVAGWLWHRYGADMPKVVLCEPSRADCLKRSLEAGRMVVVDGQLDTLMAGLACGEVSALAWRILPHATSAAMTLDDQLAIQAMRDLAEMRYADQPVVAGESAVAGLAGLVAAAHNPMWRNRLGLNKASRVLLFGTEGDTDPLLYRELVGQTAEEVMIKARAPHV